MSDFKIIGNPNPVVGVLEFYTISDFFSEISPTEEFVYIPKSPENQVKWEVYVLEFGRWRKTKENDKTGKQVTYTFFEKSLTRKGIRLLARKGDKVARLDIKPLPAHPKIDHVELLDKNGSKITGRLAYGQTVKARVFCLNMEKRRVHVTLWEDDVKGAGHSKANEKNFIETRSAIVNFGKADIDFLLRPSFAKIATKGGPENDKIHEYYVTAEYDREKTASSNVNVNAPETPVAPYKGKTTQKATAVTKTPAKQPKTELPKSDKPNAPAKAKGKINSVNITDTSGHAIKGRFREKQIKVWINSNNLIGKEVRLKLFDDDYGKDDLLFQKEFTIQSNLHAIVVFLDIIPRSWGGNFLAEGNEQELFAEVEVIQTHAFTKSAIVDVDATVFKQDPFEVFNKVLKVDMPDKKEKKEKDTCPNCKKPVTVAELKKIFTQADDATLKKASETYSKYMKELGMDTCWNKAHFFAQAVVEVGKTFTLKNGENLNYSAQRLISGDYSHDFVKGNLATKTGGHFTTGKFHKRPFSYFDTHKDEAEKYGRKDLNKNNDGLIQKADQEMIANLAYGPNSKPGKQIGNIKSTDGWKFRGRGLVQLTGRGNYDKVNIYTVKHENVNIIDYPEKVNEVNLAVLTSMGYWKNHGGDKKANGQLDEDVLSKIIGNDVDYAGKKKSFNEITSKIFQISECKFENKDSTKEEKKDGNVTIRLVRKWETDISTIGEFSIDGSDIKGYMLEEKGPDTTVSGIERRIPLGTYNLKWHNGTKQKGVLKLYNNSVPESRAILIHSGNDAADTEGCLLAGSTRAKDFVGSSKPKLKEINDYVKLKGIEGAKIIITANYE